MFTHDVHRVYCNTHAYKTVANFLFTETPPSAVQWWWVTKANTVWLLNIATREARVGTWSGGGYTPIPDLSCRPWVWPSQTEPKFWACDEGEEAAEVSCVRHDATSVAEVTTGFGAWKDFLSGVGYWCGRQCGDGHLCCICNGISGSRIRAGFWEFAKVVRWAALEPRKRAREALSCCRLRCERKCHNS